MPELYAMIGDFLGWSMGEDFGGREWSAEEKTRLDFYVSSGLSQVYETPSVPEHGVPPSYPWSFLKPVKDLTLSSGAYTLTLPYDFGGLDGKIINTTTGANPKEVDVTSDIRHMRAKHPDTTGSPRMAEIEPIKGVGQERGQRFQLHVWPTADQAYTLQVPYFLIGSALTLEAPYPLGPASMREVYIESCLAIAERRLNNASGVHALYFHERLGAAVAKDKRLKPQFVGTMKLPAGRQHRHERYGNAVTFNGSAI